MVVNVIFYTFYGETSVRTTLKWRNMYGNRRKILASVPKPKKLPPNALKT